MAASNRQALPMNPEIARQKMIEQQLRTTEVLQPAVVDILYADRREHYVPATCRALAFVDMAMPLGHGAAMLTPKLEVRLLQEAALQPGDRVLEIGTGSGHMAALLAEQAREVWTMEIEPTLAERARHVLANEAALNVHVELGDGLAGFPAQAPFDVIVVSGGVVEIPPALLAQLKEGGRLLAFVGRPPVMVLRKVVRQTDGTTVVKDLLETVVPYLQGGAPARCFAF